MNLLQQHLYIAELIVKPLNFQIFMRENTRAAGFFPQGCLNRHHVTALPGNLIQLDADYDNTIEQREIGQDKLTPAKPDSPDYQNNQEGVIAINLDIKKVIAAALIA